MVKTTGDYSTTNRVRASLQPSSCLHQTTLQIRARNKIEHSECQVHANTVCSSFFCGPWCECSVPGKYPHSQIFKGSFFSPSNRSCLFFLFYHNFHRPSLTLSSTYQSLLFCSIFSIIEPTQKICLSSKRRFLPLWR